MTVGLLLCYRWDDALALLATIDPGCLNETIASATRWPRRR